MARNWRKSDGAEALAKGLRAGTDLLFGGGDLRDTISLRLHDVSPNPGQPRRHFDDGELQHLANSLKAVGQLSPILVKPHPDEPRRYMIVAGERRWRAAELAGLGAVTAHILPDDADTDQVALIENLQRVNLSPVEEAEGIQRLMQRHSYGQEQAGALLGRSRTEVNTTLTLLRLHPAIRQECVTSHSELPKAVLLEIARMETPRQLAAWNEAKQGTLTARDARAARKGVTSHTSAPDGAMRPPRRFIAGLGRIQAGLDAGLATLDAQRPALTPAEAERLRALRARLADYARLIDGILDG